MKKELQVRIEFPSISKILGKLRYLKSNKVILAII